MIVTNVLRQLFGGRKTGKHRRYIRADLGVEGLFAALRDRRVEYAVLRWFEELPRVRPGGDVDLLVSDSTMGSISDLFERKNGKVACDVYSASGLPPYTYCRGPYLPPDKARELLNRAIWVDELYRVPSLEDHFLSLAYHAVYHKGLLSGLPTVTRGLTSRPNPKHDYAGALRRLAQQLDLDVPITMEGLAELLEGRDWRPPPQTAARQRECDPWFAAYVR